MADKDWDLRLNDHADEEFTEAAWQGLLLATEYVLGESNRVIPIEEGTLMREGTVERDKSKLKTAVVYFGPYAQRQHEDMTFRHDPGRSAKFLEKALADHKTIRDIIGRTIRGEL